MQSLCHMLFFPNILTIHQDTLNLYTQECAHSRDPEPELVQLGFLPLLTHPGGNRAWTLECVSRYPHVYVSTESFDLSQGHLCHIRILSPLQVTQLLGCFSTHETSFTSPAPVALFIILFQHTLQL